MFVAMYCWNLLFSNLMMAWIPGLLGWPTMAVKIVTMGMQAVWGFLLCRYVHLQMTFAPDGFPAAITGKRTCYLTMDAHRETCG